MQAPSASYWGLGKDWFPSCANCPLVNSTIVPTPQLLTQRFCELSKIAATGRRSATLSLVNWEDRTAAGGAPSGIKFGSPRARRDSAPTCHRFWTESELATVWQSRWWSQLQSWSGLRSPFRRRGACCRESELACAYGPVSYCCLSCIHLQRG